MSDAAFVILCADFAGDGVAKLFKTGKVPEVWKIAALPRLRGLHGAVVALQENAPAIRLFLQGQTAAIPAQPRELLDEFMFTDALERGEPGDFRIRQTHLPRPAATGHATLTFEVNGHA